MSLRALASCSRVAARRGPRRRGFFRSVERRSDIVDLGAMTPGARCRLAASRRDRRKSGRREGLLTSPEGHFVSVVDARARRVLKRIAVDGQLLASRFRPTARLYVADMNGRELLEITPTARNPARRVGHALGVAATPDGRLVIAAARDDNALVVIDARIRARRDHRVAGTLWRDHRRVGTARYQPMSNRTT